MLRAAASNLHALVFVLFANSKQVALSSYHQVLAAIAEPWNCQFVHGFASLKRMGGECLGQGLMMAIHTLGISYALSDLRFDDLGAQQAKMLSAASRKTARIAHSQMTVCDCQATCRIHLQQQAFVNICHPQTATDQMTENAAARGTMPEISHLLCVPTEATAARGLRPLRHLASCTRQPYPVQHPARSPVAGGWLPGCGHQWLPSIHLVNPCCLDAQQHTATARVWLFVLGLRSAKQQGCPPQSVHLLWAFHRCTVGATAIHRSCVALLSAEARAKAV